MERGLEPDDETRVDETPFCLLIGVDGCPSPSPSVPLVDERGIPLTPLRNPLPEVSMLARGSLATDEDDEVEIAELLRSGIGLSSLLGLALALKPLSDRSVSACCLLDSSSLELCRPLAPPPLTCPFRAISSASRVSSSHLRMERSSSKSRDDCDIRNGGRSSLRLDWGSIFFKSIESILALRVRGATKARTGIPEPSKFFGGDTPNKGLVWREEEMVDDPLAFEPDLERATGIRV